MSKAYRETYNDGITTPERVKTLTQIRGGERDANGKLLYVTEQAHKDRCDVNKIIARYRNTGMIDHVASLDLQYGDVTAEDYKTMLDKVYDLKAKFMEFPSGLRKRFDNDPSRLLDFLDNPENREEAEKLGITRSDWIYDQEKRTEERNKKTEETPAGPPTP